MTAYDDETEPIDDPTYGEIKAYYKTWGFEDYNGVRFDPLETTQCTRALLNLPEEGGVNEASEHSQESSRFFEAHKNAIGDISYYSKKFKCITDPNLRIQGDYNSAITRSLVILFEKCQQKEDSDIECKPDAEIKEWLQRKFIVTY